ncbi:hypothetical protein E4T56_gene4855 [Termitomyces sp. T112]|nr:hypothetical protein E4T56_gene4855 [Termitomyces sp. T112]
MLLILILEGTEVLAELAAPQTTQMSALTPNAVHDGFSEIQPGPMHAGMTPIWKTFWRQRCTFSQAKFHMQCKV